MSYLKLSLVCRKKEGFLSFGVSGFWIAYTLNFIRDMDTSQRENSSDYLSSRSIKEA